MTLIVKICGLKTVESVEGAIEAGADMLGFVFHPKSPRYVSLDQAVPLANRARGRAQIVALVVDAAMAQLATIHAALIPDLWQCHGGESLADLRACREAFATPIMKATGIASAADLAPVLADRGVADRLLLDAKPPEDAAYPGGHGRPFDWPALDALPPDLPFMLSGGLTPDTVGAAIRTIRGMGLALEGVDVSSGVESTPGVKDPAKIRAFVAAVRAVEREG